MSFAKLRPRRGTKTEWQMFNPILMEGELGIEYPDTGIGTGLCKFKLGNGYTKWSELPYAFNAENATSIDGGSVSVYNNVQLRRGTTDEWELADPIINAGEIIYDITKGAIKVGDGEHNFKALDYIGYSWEMENEYDFGDEDEGEIVPGPDDKVYDFGDMGGWGSDWSPDTGEDDSDTEGDDDDPTPTPDPEPTPDPDEGGDDDTPTPDPEDGGDDSGTDTDPDEGGDDSGTDTDPEDGEDESSDTDSESSTDEEETSEEESTEEETPSLFSLESSGSANEDEEESIEEELIPDYASDAIDHVEYDEETGTTRVWTYNHTYEDYPDDPVFVLDNDVIYDTPVENTESGSEEDETNNTEVQLEDNASAEDEITSSESTTDSTESDSEEESVETSEEESENESEDENVESEDTTEVTE